MYTRIDTHGRACWLRIQMTSYGWPARFRPRSLLRRWDFTKPTGTR
jgi:hypothetical protein